MHRTLRIPEILLNIFGHCSTPDRHNYGVNLASLARTCRTFKEPALDVLWQVLYDLSPLVRCLPDASRLAEPAEKLPSSVDPCYSFSRPLKEAEWNVLRSYTHRVRFICGPSMNITEEAVRVVFSDAPFDNPLFPRLQFFYWIARAAFAPLHLAVSSLISLHLNLPQVAEEFFDAFENRCPHMEDLTVDNYSSPPMDAAISHLICRWPELQQVACSHVALNMDAVSHLSSLSNLTCLEFTTEVALVDNMSCLHSELVFSNVTNLTLKSRVLGITTSFLCHIRLPAIKGLSVATEESISSRSIQAYWITVQEACPSNVLAYMKLSGSIQDDADFDDDEVLPCLTADDLRLCTSFTELRGLEFDLTCPVSLTEADLLELVSPHMEYFLINNTWGWETDTDAGGGVTLAGFVQLLQQCPSLGHLCLSIDTRTFTEIPEGLDISFPPRGELKINILDSYILPEFIPGLVSVLTALGQDPSMLTTWEFDCEVELQPLWEQVMGALKSGS